jgi:hypothetical protein
MTRIERVTSPLPRECSTTEPHGLGIAGAGEGNRTLVVSLEGFCSTIELHPLDVGPGREAHPCLNNSEKSSAKTIGFTGTPAGLRTCPGLATLVEEVGFEPT